MDKKEELTKYAKLAQAIEKMEIGDSKTVTNLSKGIVHKNTAAELLNFSETMGGVGYSITRDKNKNIKLIVRTDDNLEIREDLREIKRTILRLEQGSEENKINKKKK